MWSHAKPTDLKVIAPWRGAQRPGGGGVHSTVHDTGCAPMCTLSNSPLPSLWRLDFPTKQNGLEFVKLSASLKSVAFPLIFSVQLSVLPRTSFHQQIRTHDAVGSDRSAAQPISLAIPGPGPITGL